MGLTPTSLRRNSVGAVVEQGGGGNSLTDQMSGGVPLGYVQMTDLADAHALEPPVGATYAIMQAEGQAFRWRDDGPDPTPAVGMRLEATGELRYDGDLSLFRVVGETAGAILNISYYGRSPDA